MSYVQDNLMPNERVLYSARIHWAVFISAGISLLIFIGAIIFTFTFAASDFSQPAGVTGLCLSAFFLLSSLSQISQAIILKMTTEFAITNRRVIAKAGFIRRHTLELLLTKVESVSVNQSLMGRMLDYGNVTITGTGGTKETFRAIMEPMNVRRQIHEIIEQYGQVGAAPSNIPGPTV